MSAADPSLVVTKTVSRYRHMSPGRRDADPSCLKIAALGGFGERQEPSAKACVEDEVGSFTPRSAFPGGSCALRQPLDRGRDAVDLPPLSASQRAGGIALPLRKYRGREMGGRRWREGESPQLKT